MAGREFLERALVDLFGHEGGLVNNPADPGGLTKFGISQRAYPKVDIKALTLESAASIYARDYWDATPAGAVGTYDLAYAIFDAAVNSGPKQAVKWLQQTLGAAADGSWGPESKAALNAFIFGGIPGGTANLSTAISDYIADQREGILGARLTAIRLIAQTNMKWSDFGKGWARRDAAIIKRIGTS